MAIAGHLRLQNLFNCCSWTTGFYGFKCSGIFWAYVYQTVLGEILVCKSMLHGRKIIDFWWHLARLSPTSRTSWNVWKRFCRIESTQQFFSRSHNRHSFKGPFYVSLWIKELLIIVKHFPFLQHVLHQPHLSDIYSGQCIGCFWITLLMLTTE